VKTLHVDLRIGESVVVGGATVKLMEKSGRIAKIAITAPPDVKVDAPIRVKTGAAQAASGLK
jgi:sRNA-binding carbon storage regulator CsrA